MFKAISCTIILALIMRICGGLIDPKMECSLVKTSAGKNRWYCDGPLGKEWAYLLMQGGFYIATFLSMYIIGIIFLVYVVAFINALKMYVKVVIRVCYALIVCYGLGWVEGSARIEMYRHYGMCPIEV